MFGGESTIRDWDKGKSTIVSHKSPQVQKYDRIIKVLVNVTSLAREYLKTESLMNRAASRTLYFPQKQHIKVNTSILCAEQGLLIEY